MQGNFEIESPNYLEYFVCMNIEDLAVKFVKPPQMLTQNYALKTLELATMTTISMDNTFVFFILWSLQWIVDEKYDDGYDDDKDDFDEDGDMVMSFTSMPQEPR